MLQHMGGAAGFHVSSEAGSRGVGQDLGLKGRGVGALGINVWGRGPGGGNVIAHN